MSDVLRFDLLADSGSIDRARNTPVEIVHDYSADSYLVAFEDSESVHEVELSRHSNGLRGHCWSLNDRGERIGHCRGYVYHDTPCAHLWAIRSHVAHERLCDEDERYSDDIERALTDGGHHLNEEGHRP